MRTRAFPIGLLVMVLLLLACGQGQEEKLRQMMSELPDTDMPTVIMIFAPDCPLCLNYGAEYQKLADKYEGKARFISFLPGNQYTTEECQEYLDTSGLKTAVYYDLLWEWCKALDAKVTPEFFIVKDGAKVYSGKMDDWAALIGSKRREATEFYLEEALVEVLEGKVVSRNYTEPVGCILEYENVEE